MNTTLQNLILLVLLVGVVSIAGCEGQNQAGTDTQAEQATDTNSGGDSTTNQKQTGKNSAGNSQQQTASTSDWTEPQAEQQNSCANCGSISAIEPVAKKGEASGLGVVAGGVAGGIIGNQIGGGTGKKIATVAGAVGGALAGNEVEKYVKAEKYYAVTVDMDNGGSRTLKIANGQKLSIGQRVEVDGNNLYLR